jgi:DNA (cytosine-5)-methyltransferase 1
MKYLSVCSGVEAATVAWHDLGWTPVAFSDIEKFTNEVLAHHYPNVPNMGDMTKYKEWTLNDSIDLLVGGTPCQSFSVAGLRKGLEDPRGNLMLTYVGILDKFRPQWCVWENVPGVLSSNGGRDFGSFLGALVELGYGFAYRVLDAQNFGVPQRRRRVFVVGCLGDWESAAKVLFEPESLRWDIKKGRSKKQESTDNVAPSVGALCARDYKGIGNQYVSKGKCIVEQKPLYVPDIANCLQTTCDDYSRADGFNMIAFENSRRDGVRVFGDVSNTLQSFMGTGGGNVPCVALAENIIGRQPQNGGNGDGFTENGPMYTLNATGIHGVNHGMAVRKLTPVECERLQGFPDNYTNIPWRKKDESPDGPRYKAMGNSMAVPVMRWIGKRIAELA